MHALDSAREKNAEDPRRDSPRESDGAVACSSPATIARLLDEACAQRATLTLKLEAGTKLHIYHARIQGVDTRHMQMVLHKLTPSNWLELVTQEFDVDVSCQLACGLLRFQSTLAPLEAETVNPYCVLAMPALLHKHQLRSSYRVVMPPGASSLSLQLGERTLQGFCLNLSLEGCCGLFRGDFATLARDAVIPTLNVSLDDSLQFTTAATVCRRQLMQNGSTQLGLRFDPLDIELQRKLQTSLTGLQRRQLRKRA